MAPSLSQLLAKRYTCYYDNSYYGGQRCYASAWDNWVRWLVLVLVVVGFFALFVICSCITARRRRRAGRQPFYGTGWAARNQNQQPYYNNNNQWQQPAPPYSAQPEYGGAGGYYGGNTQQPQYGQQNGVQLTGLSSPGATYQPPNQHQNANVYEPPAGPPPGKSDGVVR